VNIKSTNSAPESFSADAVAVVVSGTDDLKALNDAFGGQLNALLEERGFKGKAGSVETVPALGHIGARHLIVAGIGDGSAADLMKTAGAIGYTARNLKIEHLAVDFGALGAAAEDVIETLGAGNYRYNTYRREDARKPAITTLTLLNAGDMASGFDTRSLARMDAQSLARELVNAPAADLYPETLAAAAKALGDIDHVEVEVISIEECEKRGYVGIVAVGQGSDKPGCLVHIKYRPPGATGHIALVGKGVTYDAGGLSIKPSAGMQTMRCDMGGAGTMLATTKAVATLGLPVNVDTFLGCVENMINGNSFKLGDVLRYNNGVTVEIHNTDAEGRLVLADCLLLASETEATTIVDAATLTGACVVALGPDYTGLFTADDGLATELTAASTDTGEGIWRLPLHAPYNRMLKATWGQIKNVGGRAAGSTTAALFLQHFVTEEKRWAHLDIAGSAFQDSKNGHWEPGATGEMVRSLTRWIATQA
jgi:leucyl aminopeptidase